MSIASPSAPDSSHRSFRIGVIVGSVAAAVVGSVLLATRDSAEKTTTRGVAATFRVPGHPGWVAAGPDALWFSLADAQPPARDRPLLHLDLASSAVRRFSLGGQVTFLTHVGSRLLASVEHVGGEGSGPSLVVALDWRTGRVLGRRQFPGLVGPLVKAGKDLWVLQVQPGALLRLDAATLVPTAAPLQLSTGGVLGLAVGGGYVWVTDAETGDIVRIDPAKRTTQRVHVGGLPHGIVVVGGNVWLVDRERGDVFRRDLRTLRPVGRPIHVGDGPAWIAPAGHYLFVGDAEAGTVTSIDLRSGERTGPPIRVAPSAKETPAFALAPSGSSVWVSSFASSTVTRITATPSPTSAPVTASSAQPNSTTVRALPRGGKVVAQIPVPPGGGAFTIGEGAVWAMSDETSTLLRIDPKRNAIVARIGLDSADGAAAGNGAVWVSHTIDDTVSRIDPRTNTVIATIPVGPSPAGVAVSPGAVWVANALDPSVTRIDPATNRVVATIRVAPDLECCATHMGLITAGGTVWVTVPNGNKLVQIDSATNAVVATVKLPYAPCGYLVVDASAVWSAGGGCEDVVARIDLRTKERATLSEPHPVGLAFANGTVWVAVLDSGNVDQIDPRTGRLIARLPVGGKPVRLAAGFGAIWVNDDNGRILRIDPGT